MDSASLNHDMIDDQEAQAAQAAAYKSLPQSGWRQIKKSSGTDLHLRQSSLHGSRNA